MKRIAGIRRLLNIQRNRAGIERAVDDELRFHFEMTMRDLMAKGMNSGDARQEAERRFGDVQRARKTLASIDQCIERALRQEKREPQAALGELLTAAEAATQHLKRHPGEKAACDEYNFAVARVFGVTSVSRASRSGAHRISLSTSGHGRTVAPNARARPPTCM